MKKIQVLALNGDYGPTCFITHRRYYADAADFMKACLLKPHNIEYDVRYLSILCIDFNIENAMNYFNISYFEYEPETLIIRDPKAWEEREKAFDYLWSIANTNELYLD